MSIIEKTQQTRNMRFFYEWSKYIFWFYPPYKMSLLSRWDYMDGGIKLLADGVWAAEDDKTGFLSVGVDIFDRLYF